MVLFLQQRRDDRKQDFMHLEHLHFTGHDDREKQRAQDKIERENVERIG